VVLHYLRRRALRLLPAYAATNLLIAVGLGSAPHAAPFRALAFSNCPSGLWRNALFITHTDVSQACGEPAHVVWLLFVTF
jgi:peptidoglycan/LPS O-acetylase OafA/YrhL